MQEWAGRNVNTFLLSVFLLLGAVVFVNRADENGRVANTDISRTDQGAYIKNAILLRDTDFTYVGRRNRMPAYPALLATFMQKGETPDGFFEKGKRINIGLALGGLIFIGAVFLSVFPRHHGLNLLFLTAFTVFVFKAPYTQAEILYFEVTFAAFLLCWRLFQKPGMVVAVCAGALLGLAHLTKASVLPGLLAFVVFYLLDAIWLRFTVGREGRIPVRFAVAALVIVAFLGAIFPYIAKSKEIYGQYFYNVNSTFYMWCESWTDVKNRTRGAGDRDGWPKMSPDEIPSMRNYLRSHTSGEIVGRLATGISRVFNSMASSYGYLWFCLAYLAFALWIAWRRRRILRRLFEKRPFPPLALVSLFGGYYLLIAWYSQIIQGNRFILGIFLPVMFTVGVFILRFSGRLEIGLQRWPAVKALTVFNVLVSIWLTVEILINCFWHIPVIYGGS